MPARSQVRGEFLAENQIFLTANLFTRTHSVRVPAFSAGAGGSSTFVHAVSQQVLKQAEIQSFIGNQVLLTHFVANCQTLPRVSLLQTPRSFHFLQIPDECLAADHRYLVSNADRKLAAATYPILGWDGPHWVPGPTYASRCGLDFDACVPPGHSWYVRESCVPAMLCGQTSFGC